MNKPFFILITLLFFGIQSVFSQRPNKGQNNGFSNINRIGNDSIASSGEITVKLNGKTKYTDYKIFSHKRDTTYIDTTLTIEKEYKFNYLRTDNFELLAFHNQGQTFNNLGYNFSDISQFPDIG